MSVRPRDWLNDLLACPVCAARMTLTPERVVCSRGHGFPIVDGVPRFTSPSTYADSFGFEWTSFPTLQLDTDRRRESEETFRIKTGLNPEAVRGRTVLDVGCGMGRFSDVVARWGAERVVGVDISRSVEAAAQNLDGYPSVSVIQADLRKLPLSPAGFDVVFSVGVLHHTPSTARSFDAITRFVKPGGVLAIWVYSRRLRLLVGGELLRPLTSRMDAKRLLRAVRWIVPKTRALKRRFPRERALIDAILPTSNHSDPDWQILDTFDWYSPKYQWKHTYPEVEEWFRRSGFVDVQRLEVPVSVRGFRAPRER